MATSTKKSTAAAKSVKPAPSSAKKSAKASPSKPVARAAPAKSPAKPSKAEAKPATKGTPTKTSPTKASPKASQAPKVAVAPKATAPKDATKAVAASKAPAPTKGAPKAAVSKPAPTTPTPAGAPPVVPGKPAAPRLTVRTPIGADELKQKIGALATATGQIRNLKRSLQKSFYEIGLILKDIDDRKLYEVKGYGSFEAFLEREIELGKHLGLKLARAVQLFQRDAAVQGGLERVSAAIAVFDGEVDPSATATTSPTSSGVRSPIPFHKQ